MFKTKKRIIEIVDYSIFYIKQILEQIAKEIWRHPESKIGLTLFKKRGEKENKILTSHSSEFVIEGYIDGGPMI